MLTLFLNFLRGFHVLDWEMVDKIDPAMQISITQLQLT